MVGVLVVGAVVLGLSLDSATAQRAGEDRSGTTQKDRFSRAPVSTPMARASRVVRGGPGLPRNLELPVLPPITVDYRDDAATRARMRGERGLAVIGGSRIVRPEGAVAGQTCFNDIECDDCNPCTVDACSEAICVSPDPSHPLDGRPCEDETVCGGICLGGDDDGGDCVGDLDCCGATPELDGICQPNACVPFGAVSCVNWPVPAGLASDGCDDGLDCNGDEFCENGACVGGDDDFCRNVPGTVCDEVIQASATCVAPCGGDAGCDDGNLCNGSETCDTGTGLCQPGSNPCGPGGECQEPSDGGTQADCEDGRCCDTNGGCTAATFQDCPAPSTWVQTVPEDACATFGNTDILDICPIYGGGIAPQGEFLVSIGPISASACDLLRVGDDYSIPTAEGDPAFVDLQLLRFAGSVESIARFAIEFYDAEGVLIEDVFFPDGTNRGVTPEPPGLAIFTVDFDPALTIPSEGFIAISIQFNFGPDGRVSILSTTDDVDLGVNDPGKMFVQGQEVSDFLGQCAGGTRDRDDTPGRARRPDVWRFREPLSVPRGRARA